MAKKLFSLFLFTLGLAAIFSPLSLSAATLHAVLVGDSTDVDIGTGILVDLTKMKEQVLIISKETGMDANTIVIQDEKVTVGEILRAIRSIKVKPDDTFLLYFSCHGFRLKEKRDPWPYLFFNPKYEGCDFLDVTQYVKSKKPRLVVAMADCCNTIIDEDDVEEPGYDVFAKAIKVNDRKANYQKLFLKQKGTVMISSSIPGQPSVGSDNGGLYTVCFLKELNAIVNKSQNEVDWKRLLDAVSKKVTATYTQNPQYELQNHSN